MLSLPLVPTPKHATRACALPPRRACSCPRARRRPPAAPSCPPSFGTSRCSGRRRSRRRCCASTPGSTRCSRWSLHRIRPAAAAAPRLASDNRRVMLLHSRRLHFSAIPAGQGGATRRRRRARLHPGDAHLSADRHLSETPVHPHSSAVLRLRSVRSAHVPASASPSFLQIGVMVACACWCVRLFTPLLPHRLLPARRAHNTNPAFLSHLLFEPTTLPPQLYQAGRQACSPAPPTCSSGRPS